MLLHICHSSWVAYTGVIVVCSCICASYRVTRTGDAVLCSCDMSLTVGGMHCRLNRMLERICRG